MPRRDEALAPVLWILVACGAVILVGVTLNMMGSSGGVQDPFQAGSVDVWASAVDADNNQSAGWLSFRLVNASAPVPASQVGIRVQQPGDPVSPGPLCQSPVLNHSQCEHPAGGAWQPNQTLYTPCPEQGTYQTVVSIGDQAPIRSLLRCDEPAQGGNANA